MSTPKPHRPSLKRNAAANYAAQIFTVIAGVVMAPVYLSYMGTEAYGLIGFFTMMTAWFQLLDIGLTPTMAREAARFRGGAISADTLRALLRALEIVFGSVSLIGAAILVFLAHTIATKWLQVQRLPVAEVAQAVMFMGLAVPLRWMSGLYRGVVNGFERQVWLSGFTILISFLRFVGVLAVFIAIGTTPVDFFAYQLGVAVCEFAGLSAMSYRISRRGNGPREPFSRKPLLANLTFSLTIAFTATAWVAISQTDKLLLSKLLPLAEYGVFALAVVAANGINAVGAPLGQAVLPRLTKLAAERDEAGLARLYDAATQGVCVVVAPAATVLFLFSEPVLAAWTGNTGLAQHAAPILRLYALGNGFVALSALAYYLQYARGDLFLHSVGNALMIATLIPLYLLLAPRYGAVGTGWSWLIVNGAYAIVWVAIVHRRVYRGQHWNWLRRNVLATVVPQLAAGMFAARFIQIPPGRWAALAVVSAVSAVLVGIAAISAPNFRARLRSYNPISSRDKILERP
jgi:O-antigen/teichoic acid export membrane protein